MSALTTADRERIVVEARTWLGTPFHHQGRAKGVGVDCAGVAVGVAKACGLEWADARGYGRIPHRGLFSATIDAVTEPVELADVHPGDLMVFAWRDDPQHVAIVSNAQPLRIIHAWQQAGACVENGFDDTWRSRLTGCRRFKKA